MKIRLALITAAVVAIDALGFAAGCCHEEVIAPELLLPTRPVVQELTAEEWMGVPEQTRKIITNNMELIIQHEQRLEQTIRSYNAWRNERVRRSK